MKNRLFALLSLPLSLAACADGLEANDGITQSSALAGQCSSRTGGALVQFIVGEDGHQAGESFTAWITNRDFITEAKRLLADGERGTANLLVRRGADCDTQWAFHADPADAEFPWGSIEQCDALPSYVSADVNKWINENKRWCPWGVRVVSVNEQ